MASTADGLAKVHVIAGEALGARAVIDTRTPIALHHWILAPGASVEVPLPRDYAAYLYVFEGAVRVGDREVREGRLAVLGTGDAVRFGVSERAQALLVAGVPLREPVARYGPFVMNTQRQLEQAFSDYQTGRMGEITRTAKVG